MIRAGTLLIGLLRDPSRAIAVQPLQWTEIIALARRELVLGHLARVIGNADILPQLDPRLQALLADGLREAAHSQRLNTGEARHIAAALLPLGCKVLILKGSAYAMAGLEAGQGRLAGDVDILVPRSYLGAAEIALQSAGWVLMVKSAYDEYYYRMWMHEVPPFQHAERKSLIDLHHTILPLTGRVQPDAKALVESAVPLAFGLTRLADADMVLHSAAHLIQDGDLNGGLRNLHDIHRLTTQFSAEADFWPALVVQSKKHQLGRALYYALRASQRYFATNVPSHVWTGLQGAQPNAFTRTLMDWLIDRRLLDLSAWQKSAGHRLAVKLLYIRSHWLRMPPLMLARHLGKKFIMRVQAKA
jgi:Uncharacterised nucleotidyltransferase